MAEKLHNFPCQTTSFVGREQELRDLDAALRSSRLVTLVGVGGTGKTRLALEYAYAHSSEYDDGAWLVELGPVTDPAYVAQAFAQAFALNEQEGASYERSIVRFFGGRSALVIVDNCEHVLNQVKSLIEVLGSSCPNVRVLATSRENLRAEGEKALQVPSLETPAEGSKPERGYAAIQLFEERARAVDPAIVLDVETVSAICRRLDGIPLAIELAAGQTKSKSPSEILLWLNERFRLLTGGSAAVVKRHQTLRSLIDWSHDMLGDDEKTLFLAVSVFRGGWTLAAAERVCQIGGVDESDVLDLLSSLAERSLITVEGGRYRMLETIREYATDRLVESGDAAAVRDLHARAYLAFVHDLRAMVTGRKQAEWLKRADAEIDNLRAALMWLLADEGHATVAFEFCAAAWRYWSARGHLTEGRSWLEQAIQRVPNRAPNALVAEVFLGSGTLAWLQADYETAAARLNRAVSLFQKSTDRCGLAEATNVLGSVRWSQSCSPGAAALYQEALAIRREIDDERGVASSLNNLAILAIEACETTEAKRLLTECYEIYTRVGDLNFAALAIKNLGTVAEHAGDLPTARDHYRRALTLHEEIGDRQRAAATKGHLGLVSLKMGELQAGENYFEQCRDTRADIGDKRGLIDSTVDFAAVALWRGDVDGAKRLFEEARQHRDEASDHTGLSSIQIYLGIIALLQGGREYAAQLLQDAVESKQRMHDLRAQGYAELWLSRTYECRKSLQIAVDAMHRLSGVGDKLGTAQAIEVCASLLARSDAKTATKLLSAADSLRASVLSVRPSFEQFLLEPAIAVMKEALGDEGFASAIKSGSSLSLDQAVALAEEATSQARA